MFCGDQDGVPRNLRMLGWAILGLQVLVMCGSVTAMPTVSSWDHSCWTWTQNSAAVFVDFPLCCTHAGAKLVQKVLNTQTFLRRGGLKGWKVNLVQLLFWFLVSLYNGSMIQFLGSSNDIKTLLSSFTGFQIIMQTDEVVADIVKIQAPQGFYALEVADGQTQANARRKYSSQRMRLSFVAFCTILTGSLFKWLYIHPSCPAPNIGRITYYDGEGVIQTHRAGECITIDPLYKQYYNLSASLVCNGNGYGTITWWGKETRDCAKEMSPKHPCDTKQYCHSSYARYTSFSGKRIQDGPHLAYELKCPGVFISDPDTPGFWIFYIVLVILVIVGCCVSRGRHSLFYFSTICFSLMLGLINIYSR